MFMFISVLTDGCRYPADLAILSPAVLLNAINLNRRANRARSLSPLSPLSQ